MKIIQILQDEKCCCRCVMWCAVLWEVAAGGADQNLPNAKRANFCYVEYVNVAPYPSPNPSLIQPTISPLPTSNTNAKHAYASYSEQPPQIS
jgi:hypothetical protein